MHPFPKGACLWRLSRTSVNFLNCDSAQWGFHPGGWGKPPLDEYNRPLYGDVFGVLPKTNDTAVRTFQFLMCILC